MMPIAVGISVISAVCTEHHHWIRSPALRGNEGKQRLLACFEVDGEMEQRNFKHQAC